MRSRRCRLGTGRAISVSGGVSVIALGEIRQGIERLNHRDATAATRLEVWLQGLYGLFSERILPITREIAEEWGRLNAQRPLPAADSLLGATANVHRLILATRNVKDLDRTGVELVNPFEFRRPH